MKKTKRVLSIILSVAVMVSMVFGSFMTAGAVSVYGKKIEKKSSGIYSSFTIIGDSVCSGYNPEKAERNEYGSFAESNFDLIANAEDNKYPYSYPSTVAGRLGLDPKANLRNFGILGFWSTDVKRIISDPFEAYDYWYYSNLQGDELLTVPYDVTLNKDDTITYNETLPYGESLTKEEQETIGKELVYNIKLADGSWPKYVEGQTYTLKKGTKVYITKGYTEAVCATIDKYFKVKRECFDDDTNLIDYNNDGKINDDDVVYTQDETGISNPQWKDSHYKYIHDNLKDSDLIALAFGGNDIVQQLIYYCVDEDRSEITNLIGLIMLGGIAGFSLSDLISMSEDGSLSAWLGIDVGDGISLGGSDGGDEDSIDALLDLLSEENMNALAEDLSDENMDALYEEVIADYKDSFMNIYNMSKADNPDAQFAAVGQFNVYSLDSYLANFNNIVEGSTMSELFSEDGLIMLKGLMSLIAKGDTENLDSEIISLVMEQLGLSSTDFIELIAMDEDERTAKIEEITAGYITTDIDELSEEEQNNLVDELIVPIMIVLLSDTVDRIVDKFNTETISMCNDLSIPYVDITGCPSPGWIDCHPDENGHAYIADRLFEAIAPTVTVSVDGGNGTIELADKVKNSKTTGNATTTRLHNSIEYIITPKDDYAIKEITVNGTVIDSEDPAYTTGRLTFADLTQDQDVVVSFEKCSHSYKKTVTKQASYSDESSEAGIVEEKCSRCGDVKSTKAILAITSVELSDTAFVYDGKEKTPEAVILDTSGNQIDKSNYSISYEGNNIDVGTVTAVIQFKGNYKGYAKRTFSIKPANQKISVPETSITARYKDAPFEIDAKGKTELAFKSSDTSVASVDAETGKVTVKGVGECTITVTAAKDGNYNSATKKVTVKVLPKKGYIDTLTASEGKIKVKMSYSLSSRGASQYQIAYRVKGNSTWKTVKTSKKTYTLSKLKKGKKYEVKVRALKTVVDKTYYGTYSTVKTSKAVK